VKPALPPVFTTVKSTGLVYTESDRLAHYTGGVLLTALTLCLAGSAQPASAQGLFQALFGGFQRRAPEPLPPQTSSYADPLGLFGNQRPAGEAGGFGHGMVYCVRTCDGRYFPLQRHAGASPAEQCKSFCPAAKTMVFSGSKIDTAVAQNGARSPLRRVENVCQDTSV
jgi:hypothetical protein